MDEDNKPVTRWDGRTTKPHPVTGEEVPDETARVMVLKYINPRKAEWPKADYVVGNPPFLGKHFLLNDLGDGYVAALRAVYDNEVPDSADFVMYWWYIASTFARANSIRRFGFVTTNSITQAFNRRILQRAFSDDPPIGLRFAIADHPWVKSEDGAAVRIAMTVGSRLDGRSLLGIVLQENETGGEDALNVELGYREGRINPDLTIGSDVTTAQALIANSGLTSNGVMLGGRGFLVLPDDEWSLNAAIVHPICNGNDVLQRSRCAKVIDFFGYEVDAAKRSSPEAFQRILDRVKPERDANRRASRRERWWLFSEVMPQLRRITANLTRFIATPETSKHRMFVFLPQGTLAEHPLIAIGLHDAYFLGVLSSRTHLVWALASGGTLEDRPRYNKSVCFNPFAFPACEENRKVGIRDLGEQLDAHRKRQQALHPKLTLTDMYNVLEKLRAGEELTDKDKVIHDQGLVSVLRQIHDDLDAAVFEAYGWPPTLADEEILQRLVELNAERAAEEARGIVRWLRPDFQQQSDSKTQRGLDLAGRAEPAEPAAATPSAKKSGKLPWPAEQAQRTKAIQAALAASPSAATAEEIAKRFLRANSTQVEEILAALASLGMARQVNGEYLPP
ncbi:MAG: DNA methyltransferase [Pirellulales bacterium]